MREIFNDPSIENKFKKQGFVIVPFIDQQKALALKEELLKLSPSDNFEGNQNTLIGQQSFHITFFDENTDYKKKVYEFVKGQFSTISKNYLREYKCFQANVFLKPAGTGFVFPHQNLTIVDEETYTSVSFWLPLQDTNFENGTICLIPGSQNNFVKYRNTHVLWPYMKFFKEGPGFDYFVPINVKAGELLIIDDRIIHYTPINKSTDDRWVVHSLWAPTEAQIQFYDPVGTEVKVFNVEDSFWQYHQPGALLNESTPYMTKPNDDIIYKELELKQILENTKSHT